LTIVPKFRGKKNAHFGRPRLIVNRSSILQVNPDVFAIAVQMDSERQKGKVRGPLHGIPFTVKDNIATKDNMETTAGSWALLGSIVPRDAHAVKRLRDVGAVLFGKATLSEWADMRSSNYSEGYSARGGQARSPYNFTVNPGGSSTGSATGVAANAVAFSIGTETDGSGELKTDWVGLVYGGDNAKTEFSNQSRHEEFHRGH
jgi:amidase